MQGCRREQGWGAWGRPLLPRLQVWKGTQCKLEEHIYGFLSMLGTKADMERGTGARGRNPSVLHRLKGCPASRNLERRLPEERWRGPLHRPWASRLPTRRRQEGHLPHLGNLPSVHPPFSPGPQGNQERFNSPRKLSGSAQMTCLQTGGSTWIKEKKPKHDGK